MSLDRHLIEVLLGLKPGEIRNDNHQYTLITMEYSDRPATVTVEYLIRSGHLLKTGSGLVVTKLGRASIGITEEECAS